MSGRANWFWRRLWRFNALVIAVAGLAVLVAATLVSATIVYEVLRRPTQSAQVVAIDPDRQADEQPVDVKPEGLNALGDTGLVYASLTANAEVRRAGLRRYGSKSVVNVIDWLIYDPRSAAPPRRLIGRDVSLLIEATLLSYDPPGAELATEDLAIFVRFVSEDTNGDGLLTRRDAQTYAIASNDGRDLTPLEISGEFLGLKTVSARETLLSVWTEGRAQIAHIDLPTKKIVRRAQVETGAP